MKKMTLAIIITALITGSHAIAFAGHGGRRVVSHDENRAGTVRAGQHGWGKSQNNRRCRPGWMKVWVNGQVSRVQVTVCKKKGTFIVSPIHINFGSERMRPAHGPAGRRNQPFEGGFSPHSPIVFSGR